MGRFSWGKARAKSRKETSTAVVDATDEVEQEKGDSVVLASSSASSSSTTSVCVSVKFLWVLALCATAIFGYCMEATPGRFSNAMFSNHLFSVSSFPSSKMGQTVRYRQFCVSVTFTTVCALFLLLGWFVFEIFLLAIDRGFQDSKECSLWTSYAEVLRVQIHVQQPSLLRKLFPKLQEFLVDGIQTALMSGFIH